jgi:transposase
VYEARGRGEASYRLNILLGILRRARLNRGAQEWLGTLTRWEEEILNYFLYRSTNARIESFTGQAKLIQRVSCGLRDEEVYKRKVLLRAVPYNAFSHSLL